MDSGHSGYFLLKLLIFPAIIFGFLFSITCGSKEQPTPTPTILLTPASTIITITQDYTVGAGQIKIISVDLEKDDLLEFSVTVRGGGLFDNIGVRVEDPAGLQVVTPQTVQSQDFIIKAKKDGRYAVVLDNSYNIFSGKFVTLVLKHPQR